MISYVTEYRLIKVRHECGSDDQWLGKAKSVEQCANLCKKRFGCKYFIKGLKIGEFGDANTKVDFCYWEKTLSAHCPEGWEHDYYGFYELATEPYALGTIYRTN